MKQSFLQCASQLEHLSLTGLHGFGCEMKAKAVGITDDYAIYRYYIANNVAIYNANG
jgi:hypothetical protein